MGKSSHTDNQDALLNNIKTNSTRLCVCSTEPTTYAQAITTYKLAIATITSANFTGPSTVTTNRRLVSIANSSITVDASGDAQHVALADSVNSKLLYVTTCTLQTLTAGNLVNVPLFNIDVANTPT